MKSLSAKQYLGQLEVIDTKINQKMEELNDLMIQATSTEAIDYSKDRVQTSPKNTQENKICKYVDLNDEINREIDEFVGIKHQVTKQIQALNVNHYIKVLFKVYVQFKTVKVAADEMGVSYQYARDLHKKALKAFEKMSPDLKYLT